MRVFKIADQGRVQNSSLGAKIEEPKAESWGGVLGEGTAPPPARWSGERCELPQRASGRSPDRPTVFRYFQHSEWPLLTL